MDTQLTQQTALSANPPTGDATTATTTTRGWPGWLGGLVIVAAVLAVYLPKLPTGIIWDDDQYLTNPPQHRIAPPEGDNRTPGQLLKEYWATTATPQYYPLVFTSYWLEYYTGIGRFEPKFDTDKHSPPKSYHVVNIALHALTSLLLWRVMVHLKVPGAWVIAMVFALHPMQTETVRWITERKNTLSGFFYMAALLCYLKFASGRGWGLYAVSLLTFVCALLSKTVTASLPAVALLALWMAKERVALPRLAALLPFFLIGVPMGLFTGWYEFHKEVPEYYKPMPITQAAKLAMSAEGRDKVKKASKTPLDPSQRALVASRSLLHYTKQTIMPWPRPIPQDESEGGLFSIARGAVMPKPLAFYYHRWDEKVELDAKKGINFWPVALIAACAVATIVLSVVYGRGIFVAVAFFVITIFPALGLISTWPTLYSFVADHFAYLACIGVIALVVGGAAAGLARVGKPLAVLNGATPLGALVAVALIAYLNWATVARIAAFHNEETLWLDTITKTPDAWAARINLGRMYGERANKLNTERKKAQEAKDNARVTDLARLSTESLGKAAEQFQAIIDGKGRFQDKAYENLASVRAMQNRLGEAVPLFIKAIELQPKSISLYQRLASALSAQGKHRAAVNRLQQALAMQPDNADIRKQLAAASARAAQMEREASSQPGSRPAGAQTRPTIPGLDLSGVKTPEDRRKVYLQAIDKAMAARDYVRAWALIQSAMQQENLRDPNPDILVLQLWKRSLRLWTASPIDNQRNSKMGVPLAMMLRNSFAKKNVKDAELPELLGMAYADSGKFEEALKAAKAAQELATATQNAEVSRRLTEQIRLYEAKMPYRLPPPAETQPTTQPKAES